jgi:hypothetical protein
LSLQGLLLQPMQTPIRLLDHQALTRPLLTAIQSDLGRCRPLLRASHRLQNHLLRRNHFQSNAPNIWCLQWLLNCSPASDFHATIHQMNIQHRRPTGNGLLECLLSALQLEVCLFRCQRGRRSDQVLL